MMKVYDKKSLNRLKRAEGQMRGVQQMMEDGKDCRDVVTQLSAIRSSIDRAIGLIVAENLAECVRENQEQGVSNQATIEEAINLIVKTRG